MSWITDTGNLIGEGINNLDNIVTTVGKASHDLLGSTGSLSIGDLHLSTGITSGDVITRKDVVTRKGTTIVNSNIGKGLFSEIDTHPILLIVGIVIIIFLIKK